MVGMFLRSPIGRLVGFAVTAIVIVVVIVKVVDRGSGIVDSVTGNDDKRLYVEENFSPIMGALTKKVGANAELLNVTIRPDRVEFQVRNGEKADGFVSDGGDDFESVDVQLFGNGSIDATTFPLSSVKPAVPEQLVNSIKRQEKAKEIILNTETFERDLVSGDLQWKVNGTADGTGFQYTAKPNGSGLSKAGAPVTATAVATQTTKTQPAGPKTTTMQTTPTAALENTRKYGDCVREAGTDISKVRACEKYL